jgi:hypothetical protein
MKLTKIFMGLLLSAFLVVPCFAANTTTVGPSLQVIQIVPDGSTDWTWSTEIDALSLTARQESRLKAAKIVSIVFYPSAANDRMIIHDGGIDNAAYFDSGAVSGADDPRIVHYELRRNVELVIDATDCTLDTAASTKVLIYVDYQ